MSIDDIEKEIKGLHNGLNLRTTVETARKVGLLLLAGKKLLAHGGYLPWLKAVGINRKSAAVYCQVARVNVQLSGHMTLADALSVIRKGRRIETRELLQLPDRPSPAGAVLHTADCRRHKWPVQADAIVTDPPWQDDAAYDWLATFAVEKLRAGGLLLVQCGTPDLPDRYRQLQAAGLVYCWTLAIVYDEMKNATAKQAWGASWRPVLAFSRGKKDRHAITSDTYTVRKKVEKRHHPWEQPLEPFRHWVGKLTAADALVLDPFAGSGTIGVACVETGRRYIGTEIEKSHARTARGRIAAAEKMRGESVRPR